MASTTQISAAEYLSTTFRPDRELVDGMLVERNVGEKDHSKLQTAIAAWFHARRRKAGWHVFVEQRIRVSSTRFRIPDVCVVVGEEPPDQVFQTAPNLCIEILSRDDRMREIEERIRDYFALGVPEVWVIDPKVRAFWCYTALERREITEEEIKITGSSFRFPWRAVLEDRDA